MVRSYQLTRQMATKKPRRPAAQAKPAPTLPDAVVGQLRLQRACYLKFRASFCAHAPRVFPR